VIRCGLFNWWFCGGSGRCSTTGRSVGAGLVRRRSTGRAIFRVGLLQGFGVQNTDSTKSLRI
ncbi:MAG: hypothetical protein ACYCTG_07310, partial [Ferrimicrobium sp.]